MPTNLPPWDEVGRWVLASLEEDRAWKLRVEVKMDHLNKMQNMVIGVVVFVGVVGPVIAGLIARRVL